MKLVLFKSIAILVFSNGSSSLLKFELSLEEIDFFFLDGMVLNSLDRSSEFYLELVCLNN